MPIKNLKIQVFSQNGEKIKEIELNSKIFGVEVKSSVIHQVVVAQMANSRVAIAHTKDRSEVSGGGIKPWRQKGTGRARHGSNRSPLWVGGGVTFGPTKDRNFSKKVNQKQKTKALFMCLSDKVNNSLFILLDKLNISEGKTKEIISVLKSLRDVLKLKIAEKNFDIKKYKLSLLIVLEKSDKKAFNATRNLTGVKITTADSLNVLDLLKYKNILITEESLEIITKVYLK
ncbi:MAG: 50S ribosomal protein L4 [Patescibacteria group bacterium]